MLNYPPELLLELYENIPEELQDAIFSEEIADKISDICARNGIKDEDTIFEIAKYVCYVLIGILPPNELGPILKKDLNFAEDLAKQIGWEISRFIFFPLKDTLEPLYKIAIEPGAKPTEAVVPKTPEEGTEEKEISKKKDIYREEIE